MNKFLGIVVLGLLLSTNAYAWKFQEVGISFETYSKSCKRHHFLTKKNWPQFIGEEGEYKIYNCWKTDTIGYGEVQIFKNNTLIRNEKSLQRPSQGTFDVTTFLIGLSLLTGNTPSTTTNNQTTPVPGFLTGETISGFNKICYYNRVTGTVTLNIPSTSLCPLTY